MNIKSTPTKPPMLYTTQLGKYLVVFNRLGNKGVTVLAPKIQPLFELCNGQYSIEELHARLQCYTIDETARIVEVLAAQGVLEIDGYDAPRAPRKGMLIPWIHVTNGCNMACEYCCVKKDGRPMSKETARATVDALYRAAALHPEYHSIWLKLAGGEPLTNLPVVREILNYSRDKTQSLGIQRTVAVLTNGTVLTSEILGLLKEHEVRVSVSLDGLGEFNDERKFRTGKPTVSVVLANIDLLRQEGIPVFVLVTITEKNLVGLLHLTRYLLERGIGFRYGLYRDLEKGNHVGHIADEMIDTLNTCYDLFEMNLPSTPFGAYHSFVNVRLAHPIRRSCGISENGMLMAHTGEVYLCQTDIGKRPPVGTVADEDILASVRNQEIIPELRLFPSVDDYDGCSSCEWRCQCGGGCPLLNKLANGKMNSPSPYCSVYRAVIPRLIKITGLQIIRAAEQAGAQATRPESDTDLVRLVEAQLTPPALNRLLGR